MASVRMRHVGSPLSITGVVLFSPKLNQPACSPHYVSSLKNSTPVHDSRNLRLTPSCFKKRNNLGLTASESPKRGKSVRRLSWSDGGKYAPIGRNITAFSVLPLYDTPKSSKKIPPDYPSFDTPNRAEALRKFKLKSSIIEVLGKGRFGTVVQASYKGNLVAVKILQSSPEAHSQIINEMNSLKLHHSNIVSVLKVLPEAGVAGIVIMERVPGFSLQKILDRGLLQRKPFQRLRYSLQLSSALAYCHEHGVLHLDVKPRNILVDVNNDTCKLCDFGSSCPLDAENYKLQGTVGYVAPELLRGGKPTTAADVYSLGITMWQLMSGKVPYSGEPEHTIIYKVVATEYRPELPKFLSFEDEKYISLYKKCWAQDPQMRPSIPKIIEELILEYPFAK